MCWVCYSCVLLRVAAPQVCNFCQPRTSSCASQPAAVCRAKSGTNEQIASSAHAASAYRRGPAHGQPAIGSICRFRSAAWQGHRCHQTLRQACDQGMEVHAPKSVMPEPWESLAKSMQSHLTKSMNSLKHTQTLKAWLTILVGTYETRVCSHSIFPLCHSWPCLSSCQ